MEEGSNDDNRDERIGDYNSVIWMVMNMKMGLRICLILKKIQVWNIISMKNMMTRQGLVT